MHNYIKEVTFIGKGVRAEFDGKDVSIQQSKHEYDTKVYLYDGYPCEVYVSGWHSDTPEEVKRKKIKWTILDHYGHIVDNITKITAPCKDDKDKSNMYKLKFPLKYSSSEDNHPWLLHIYMEDESFGTSNFIADIHPVSKKRIATAAKIIHSGRVVEPSEKIGYGTYLTFLIETEGLERCHAEIYIYNKVVSGEDVCIYKGSAGQCIYGNLTIRNVPTLSWVMNKSDNYYVKIKSIYGSNTDFIKQANSNEKIIEFSFDRSQNIINNKDSMISENVTLTTIKDMALDNAKEYDHCAFSKLGVEIGNRKEFILFDENALAEVKEVIKYNAELEEGICYFDFDESDLNFKNQYVIDKYVQYFVDNPKIPIIIDGHTDDWGPDAYNTILGEKRAKSVADYLVEKGVSLNRISLRSYGENRNVLYNARTKAENEKNRRVEVKFKMEGLSRPSVIYNIVGKTMGEKTKINVYGYKGKDCIANPSHDRKVHVTETFWENSRLMGYEKKEMNLIDEQPKQSDEKLLVKSPKLEFEGFVKMFKTYFNHAKNGIPYNSYKIDLNTCAYFPKTNGKHSVGEIRVHPDNRFVFHALFDSDNYENFRLNDFQGIALERGAKFDSTWAKNTLNKILAGIPLFNEYIIKDINDIADSLFEFLNDDIIGKYQYGVHNLYDFDGSMKIPANVISHTADYKTYYETMTWIVLIMRVVVEILLVVLTEGADAIELLQKVKKLKKLEKLGEFMDKTSAATEGIVDLSFEFQYMKGLIAGELFYGTENDRVGPNFRLLSALDPLIGVKLEAGLLENKKLNKDVKSKKGLITNKIFDWAMGKAKEALGKVLGFTLSLKLTGDLVCCEDINYNFLADSFFRSDKGPAGAGEVAKREGEGCIALDFEAKANAKKLMKFTILTGNTVLPILAGIMDLTGHEAQFGTNLNGKIGLIIRAETAPGLGPCITYLLKVYPIVGSFTFNEMENYGSKKGSSKQDNIDKDNIIWEGDEYVLYRISLLSGMQLLPDK